jgi:plasmid stabilization system protein ParE
VAADRYIDHLRERALELLDFPELGCLRHEIAPDLRSLLARNHLLFYRIQSNEFKFFTYFMAVEIYRIRNSQLKRTPILPQAAACILPASNFFLFRCLLPYFKT